MTVRESRFFCPSVVPGDGSEAKRVFRGIFSRKPSNPDGTSVISDGKGSCFWNRGPNNKGTGTKPNRRERNWRAGGPGEAKKVRHCFSEILAADFILPSLSAENFPDRLKSLIPRCGKLIASFRPARPPRRLSTHSDGKISALLRFRTGGLRVTRRHD